MTTEKAKYILKEFFNKSAYGNIYAKDETEKDECLRFLEDSGLMWRGLSIKPTEFKPRAVPVYFSIIEEELAWGEGPNMRDDKTIDWSELRKIISLF